MQRGTSGVMGVHHEWSPGGKPPLPLPDRGSLWQQQEQDWWGLRSLGVCELLAERGVGLSRMTGDYYTALFVKVQALGTIKGVLLYINPT